MAVGKRGFFIFLAGMLVQGCAISRQPACEPSCYVIECEGMFEGTEVVSAVRMVAEPVGICRNEEGRGNPVSSVRLRFDDISRKTLQEIQGQLFTCPGLWMIRIEKQ